MRRLVELWIIAHARQYAPGQDHASWKESARAELRAMVPELRRSPLGVGVLAETLDAIEECRADDFEALVAGAPDRAAEAYHVAAAATCEDNWARAVLTAPDRALPALVRMASYGGLSLSDSIALHQWLTTPAVLARVREADRPKIAALLWQRYLAALFKAGLASRALALLDAMTPDLRAAVLSPDGIAARPVVMDGVGLTFGSEVNQSPPPAVIPTEAPIYAVGEALAEAVLSGAGEGGPSPSAAIVCHVCPVTDYPGLCARAEHGEATSLDEQFALGDQADTRALERKALAAAVPGFAGIRAVLRRDAPPVHPDSRPRRATVVAGTPPFTERPIAAGDHTPAAVAGAVGLAPLPPGFQLVRAERQGARAVAISVSQALNPTGEVSRGGY